MKMLKIRKKLSKKFVNISTDEINKLNKEGLEAKLTELEEAFNNGSINDFSYRLHNKDLLEKIEELKAAIKKIKPKRKTKAQKETDASEASEAVDAVEKETIEEVLDEVSEEISIEETT